MRRSRSNSITSTHSATLSSHIAGRPVAGQVCASSGTVSMRTPAPVSVRHLAVSPSTRSIVDVWRTNPMHTAVIAAVNDVLATVDARPRETVSGDVRATGAKLAEQLNRLDMKHPTVADRLLGVLLNSLRTKRTENTAASET